MWYKSPAWGILIGTWAEKYAHNINKHNTGTTRLYHYRELIIIILSLSHYNPAGGGGERETHPFSRRLVILIEHHLWDSRQNLCHIRVNFSNGHQIHLLFSKRRASSSHPRQPRLLCFPQLAIHGGQNDFRWLCPPTLGSFCHLPPWIGAILLLLLSGGPPQNINMLPCTRHTVWSALAAILTQRRSADWEIEPVDTPLDRWATQEKIVNKKHSVFKSYVR